MDLREKIAREVREAFDFGTDMMGDGEKRAESETIADRILAMLSEGGHLQGHYIAKRDLGPSISTNRRDPV